MIIPCHECTKRTAVPNCHANCEKYQEFAKWREGIRLKRQLANIGKDASIANAQKRVHKFFLQRRK